MEDLVTKVKERGVLVDIEFRFVMTASIQTRPDNQNFHIGLGYELIRFRIWDLEF